MQGFTQRTNRRCGLDFAFREKTLTPELRHRVRRSRQQAIRIGPGRRQPPQVPDQTGCGRSDFAAERRRPSKADFGAFLRDRPVYFGTCLRRHHGRNPSQRYWPDRWWQRTTRTTSRANGCFQMSRDGVQGRFRFASVVPSGLVSNDVFLAGYGAAQAVPGPLFTFAAYLASAMASNVGGRARCGHRMDVCHPR